MTAQNAAQNTAQNTAMLRTDGLCKNYGALAVTNSVSLDVLPGELHAIIGPNGAGKTTLLGQLSGELAPTAGRIFLDGEDITDWPTHGRAGRGLRRSYQITAVFDDFTVRENVVLAALAGREHAFRFWRPMTGRAAAARAADEAMAAIGLSGLAETPAADLAHGERRQLELAMALAAEPRVLLLDEPMAGMSAQESAAVVDLLRGLKGRHAILLIEHDMDAVFALADRISVLVQGRILCTGTPDEIRDNDEVRAVYLGEDTEEGI